MYCEASDRTLPSPGLLRGPEGDCVKVSLSVTVGLTGGSFHCTRYRSGSTTHVFDIYCATHASLTSHTYAKHTVLVLLTAARPARMAPRAADPVNHGLRGTEISSHNTRPGDGAMPLFSHHKLTPVTG